MQAIRIISKVLPNGVIALPEEFNKKEGEMFEVILIPFRENIIFSYCENIIKEKKIPRLSESALSKIIHSSRKKK